MTLFGIHELVSLEYRLFDIQDDKHLLLSVSVEAPKILRLFLPGWFLNVPFCNFAAWFGAFLPFAWAYFYLDSRDDLTMVQKNWKLFVHVPLIALIAGLIWLTLMTIYEGGFSGPTYEILNAFFDKLIPYST